MKGISPDSSSQTVHNQSFCDSKHCKRALAITSTAIVTISIVTVCILSPHALALSGMTLMLLKGGDIAAATAIPVALLAAKGVHQRQLHRELAAPHRQEEEPLGGRDPDAPLDDDQAEERGEVGSGAEEGMTLAEDPAWSSLSMRRQEGYVSLMDKRSIEEIAKDDGIDMDAILQGKVPKEELNRRIEALMGRGNLDRLIKILNGLCEKANREGKKEQLKKILLLPAVIKLYAQSFQNGFIPVHAFDNPRKKFRFSPELEAAFQGIKHRILILQTQEIERRLNSQKRRIQECMNELKAILDDRSLTDRQKVERFQATYALCSELMSQFMREFPDHAKKINLEKNIGSLFARVNKLELRTARKSDKERAQQQLDCIIDAMNTILKRDDLSIHAKAREFEAIVVEFRQQQGFLNRVLGERSVNRRINKPLREMKQLKQLQLNIERLSEEDAQQKLKVLVAAVKEIIKDETLPEDTQIRRITILFNTPLFCQIQCALGRAKVARQIQQVLKELKKSSTISDEKCGRLRAALNPFMALVDFSHDKPKQEL